MGFTDGGRLGDARLRCRISVVIPALNEEKAIGHVVRGIRSLLPGVRVIVVDDGSTDRTAQEALKAGARVIRFLENRGQWEALRVGFRKALELGSDVVVSMDGDGQHDPADMPSLLKPILAGEADLVIGSRFYRRKRIPGMRGYRYAGIRFFSWLIRLLTRSKITDVMSGYRAYRAELLAALVDRLRERRYGVLEATLMAWRLGARICERPIRFRPRRRSRKGSLRYLVNLCRVLLRALLTRP